MFDRTKFRPPPSVVVKVECPICADQIVPARAITLRLVEYNERLSTYEFTCPSCGLLIEKAATGAAIWLLRSAQGVRIIELTIPAEWRERVTAGPPIDYDELMDLMVGLRDISDVAGAAIRGRR
ncbi:MAG: hypothetical protein ACRC0L_05695 [Angustibacter sp.]